MDFQQHQLLLFGELLAGEPQSVSDKATEPPAVTPIRTVSAASTAEEPT